MPDIPTNNIELYLANIVGESEQMPDFPTNKIERYLAKIAENGGGGGGGGGETEVFWATYDTTTSAQLEEAFQDGKEILVERNTRIYRLALRESAQYHVFTAFVVASNNLYCYLLYCNTNNWTSASVLYPKSAEITYTDTGSVSKALDAGKIYHFTGAVTALTITFNAAAGGEPAHYHFDFDSSSTAPTLTLPNTVTMPSGFTVEASKHYEIDILNNYGTVMAW